MGRKSKLTDLQWSMVHSRVMAGEPLRSVAKDFGISAAAIVGRFGKVDSVAEQSERVNQVAHKIAEAHTALESLPPVHRPVAMSLAERLKSISDSLTHAADLGAKTAHRLQALANSEVAKVDDADPLQSLDALKGVNALTKLANDSAAIALNLIAANKETVVKINTDPPKSPGLPVKRLSTEALREIVAAKNG